MEFILSVLLIGVALFYLFGFLGRLLLRRFLRKSQQTFFGTFGTGGYTNQTGQRKPKPEGKVTIQQTGRSQKKVRTDVGDYVEFEEITESEQYETK